MRVLKRGVVGVSCVVWLAACGNKDDRGSAKEATPAAPQVPGAPSTTKPSAPASGASWAAAPVSFKASWQTSGEATKGAVLTGTLHVGPDAVRLDIDNHPSAGHPVSFVRLHKETDLWRIDATTKEYDRALSGDWEHDIIPRVVDEDDPADLAACPFGRASAACAKLGDDTVAGIPVEKWQYRKRTIWVAPSLRVGLKEAYTPYRNNPSAQEVVLASVETGAQAPALFVMPADFACKARAFCDSAPK